MLLSSLIILFCQDHVLFHAYPFNRSVVFTFKLFHLIKFCFSFQSECCQNYIIPIHSYLVSTRVVSIPSCPLCSSFMSLQPSSSRYVPCSSFLTDCLQSWSSPLFCFLSICPTSQGSLVSLCGRRSNLVLPLIFLFLFPPLPSQISGRDPLVVVECCNAPDTTFHIRNSDSSHFRLCD